MPHGLPGLAHESKIIRTVLAGARQGHGAIVLVEGQAGTGRTALLKYAVRLSLREGYLIGASMDVPALTLFGTPLGDHPGSFSRFPVVGDDPRNAAPAGVAAGAARQAERRGRPARADPDRVG
jgi:hypothetical protein